MKDTQLLCTFCTNATVKSVLQQISSLYKIVDNKTFVFENKKNVTEKLVTYNIFLTSEGFTKLPNTISIHRKKQSNTLYTINALNKIIAEENNGVIDKSYVIEWDLYKDCIILTTDEGFKVIELELVEIKKI